MSSSSISAEMEESSSSETWLREQGVVKADNGTSFVTHSASGGWTERLSLVSVTHLLGFFLVFSVITFSTVMVMNCVIRRRQQGEEAEPFIPTTSGGNRRDLSPSPSPAADDNRTGARSSGEGGSSSSRARFLEQRKRTAQQYGATDMV